MIACDLAHNAGPSNLEAQRHFWKRIWQLRTPNKIKHFIWKACNNALPTMAKLHHRYIVTTEICADCQDQTEDTLHALWSCKEIACVWHSMEWFHHDVAGQPMSFGDLISRFLHYQEDDYRLELFSIMAWLLWNRCNAKHFGCLVQPLTKICSLAGNYLQEFLAFQAKPSKPPDPIILQQWRPPDNNVYKVNFDAATFRTTNSAGIGVIVRDCVGEVIGALSMPIPMPQSVVAVEALACRQAVKFAAEIGLTRVVFEGDSAVIINAISSTKGD